jgi:hypothetical protein
VERLLPATDRIGEAYDLFLGPEAFNNADLGLLAGLHIAKLVKIIEFLD